MHPFRTALERKPFDQQAALAMLQEHTHVPAEGQTEQQFKDDVIAGVPGLTLEQWAMSAPMLIKTNAMPLTRIQGWSIEPQVRDWIAELNQQEVVQTTDVDPGGDLIPKDLTVAPVDDVFVIEERSAPGQYSLTRNEDGSFVILTPEGTTVALDPLDDVTTIKGLVARLALTDSKTGNETGTDNTQTDAGDTQ